MSHSGPPPSDRYSKYGLPRNYVVSINRGRVPGQAEAWLRQRDDIEGLLLDELDAYKRGIIGEHRYDRERRRLTIARSTADHRYERAMRTHKKDR